jgi:hypothetical protein
MPHQNPAPSDMFAAVGGRLLNFETLFGIELGPGAHHFPRAPGPLFCVAPRGVRSKGTFLCQAPLFRMTFQQDPFEPDRWWFAPLLYAGAALMIAAIVLA